MGICSRSRTFFFSLQWIERSKKKVEANGNLRRSAGSYGKPWSEVTSFFLSFFVFSPFFHCSSGPAAAAPVCCVRVSLLGCRPNAAAAAALSIHSFASTLFVDTRSFIQTCCRVAFCPFSVFFFSGAVSMGRRTSGWQLPSGPTGNRFFSFFCLQSILTKY